MTDDVRPILEIDAALVAGDREVALALTIRDGHLGLLIGERLFSLEIKQQDSGRQMLAVYHKDEGEDIKIAQLTGGLSSLFYVPENLTINLKDALLIVSETGSDSGFLFGLHLGTEINLANLPMIGSRLPSSLVFSISDLQVIVVGPPAASGIHVFSKDKVEALNKLLPQGVRPLPEQDLVPWLNLSASVKLDGVPRTLVLGGAAENQPPAPEPAQTKPPQAQPAPGALTSTKDNTKWIVVEKTLGPVSFKRVGMKFAEGKAWLKLDTALSAMGLTISLDGLAAGFQIGHVGLPNDFRLDGLGIDYRGGPVEIAGSFLRLGDAWDSFAGAATIKTAKFTLSAMGAYSKVNGQHSVFVYAFLNYPLGGPAFFFITGLALGFGYNRKLIVPAIGDVANFPLVKEAVEGTGKPDKLLDELTALQPHIPPTDGESFLAVGLKFTTFKLIDSFALLTIEFGSRVVFNIIGLSTAIVPTPEAGQNVTPLAEVQMAWKATFDPGEGFLGLSAQLTSNSYLLSRDCHLTGCFAFYSWFAGEHAGDFVQTMGGYHPAFEVPAHYPSLPRLQFNWRVSGNLTLKGDAYYALCGSALMAGGHLEAVWESGDLKAWFKAGADFLIQWKPYHYDASIYVDVGVSYTFNINLLFTTVRVTISVDVGADLHIWGPDFSGHARVHLWIITFGIDFGAGASQESPAIDWSTFKKSFLPAEDVVCSVVVKEGLVRTLTEGSSERWVINPKHFALVVNSAIPFRLAYEGNEEIHQKKDGMTEITKLGEPQPLDVKGTGVGIGAMAVTTGELETTLTITIKRDGTNLVDDDFTYIPILKKVPAGLWGESRTPDLNGEHFIENALTGFEITPEQQPQAGLTAPIDRDKLKVSRDTVDSAYSLKEFKAFQSSGKAESIDDIARSNSARDEILKSLGFDHPQDIVKVQNLSAKVFLAPPQVGSFAG